MDKMQRKKEKKRRQPNLDIINFKDFVFIAELPLLWVDVPSL
ncbi:MAG: hypothetical protein WKF91_21935 [Segetibacter sp.]